MPNLHNRYKSAERKISQKNPEYTLNYSLLCSCMLGLIWFSGFRGEDLNVKVYDVRWMDDDDDGHQVMAKTSMAFGQVS